MKKFFGWTLIIIASVIGFVNIAYAVTQFPIAVSFVTASSALDAHQVGQAAGAFVFWLLLCWLAWFMFKKGRELVQKPAPYVDPFAKWQK